MKRTAVLALLLATAACASGPQRTHPPAEALVYYHDPENRHGVVAVGWDGLLKRHVDLPPPAPVNGRIFRPQFTASPDGSRLLLSEGWTSSSAIFSSAGQRLIGLPSAAWVWADDSRHLCSLLDAQQKVGREISQQTGPNTFTIQFPPLFLYLASPDGTVRQVSPAPSMGSHGGPTIAACSMRTDTAVILNSFTVNTWVESVVRLSTGSQIGGRWPPPGAGPRVGSVLLAPDARLAAVASFTGGKVSASVVRLPGYVEQADLGDISPVGFSGDGGLVVAVTPNWQFRGNNSTKTIQVIDWKSGRTVWSHPGFPLRMMARPDGRDLMLELLETIPAVLEDVWIVRPGGKATEVAHQVPTGYEFGT